MKSGPAKHLELLERRVELLGALIRAEQQWRLAFIALKLGESEGYAADAERICECIRVLDKEITSLQASVTKFLATDPVIDRGIRAAQAKMKALHLNLRQSNRTKQAILRRSKLTMSALRNLFNSHAPTYAAPAAASTGTIFQETV